MPCSSRACRLENELTDGSLGTIFHFPRPFHLAVRDSRSALPRGWARDFIPRHDLLEPVCALRLHGDSLWFLGRERPLIGHLGGCHGCDPDNEDRRATHAWCEALHIC